MYSVNFLCPLTGRRPWPRSALVLALAAVLAGCGRDETQVYHVEKEKPASAAAQAPFAGENPHGLSAGRPRLTWKLPAGWIEKAPGEMRLASFQIKGAGTKQADVSVIPLPGPAGGDLNNVNRWRGQVGQAPVTQEELAKLAEKVDIGGAEGALYDQAGQNAAAGEKSRILAALLHRDDGTWFFKMTGDDELVAQQKPALVEFLKSLHFEAPEAQPALPPSHPPIGAAPETAAASGPAKPNWTVPAAWKEEPPTQMLIAKFTATDHDAKAEITVSAFPGDVGGLLANVNRWRGQVGLPPLGEADLPTATRQVEAQGVKATLVELEGAEARTGKKTRLVGLIVPQAGQTWFYKMMGDEAVVAGQKDALIQFAQSAK